MTRSNPTDGEVAAGSALRDWLIGNGRSVETFNFDDRPDIRAIVGGESVAYECVQIPPGRVLKFQRTRFKQLAKSKDGAVVHVVWPVEPHYWVKETIENKQRKLAAYRKNALTEFVGLLIHTPIDRMAQSLRYENESIIQLLRYGAKIARHQFSEIWFWSPNTGILKIHPLFPPAPDISISFENGYPTEGFRMMAMAFSTTAHGEEPKIYASEVLEPELIVIPPADPNFKAHSPNFRPYKYRLKMVAEATSVTPTIEIIEGNEDGSA